MKSEVLWPGKAVSSSKIFLYGSLLEDCCNHHVIASAKKLFDAQTKAEYDLIDLGEYPCLGVRRSHFCEGLGLRNFPRFARGLR